MNFNHETSVRDFQTNMILLLWPVKVELLDKLILFDLPDYSKIVQKNFLNKLLLKNRNWSNKNHLKHKVFRWYTKILRRA